jgi:hypothetical protein
MRNCASEQNDPMGKTKKYNTAQTRGEKETFRIGEEIKYTITGKEITVLEETEIKQRKERHQ